MRIVVLHILLIYAIAGCKPQNEMDPAANDAPLQDEKAILTTVNNVYGNIVVDSVNTPDFELIKRQFTSGARLGYLTGDSLVLKSPQAYFDHMAVMLDSDSTIVYLREWEIQGETRQFGDIAQRTSLYGVHFNTTDSLAERGIINFQLVQVKGEWKILSMIWQAEREDLQVSESYFECVKIQTGN